jgi:hypothetical protein
VGNPDGVKKRRIEIMTPKKPRSEWLRIGPPYGNKNALKHGLFAHHYTKIEAKAIARSREDMMDEIGLLRVFLDRIATILDTASEYSLKEIALLKTLESITVTIGTHLRTGHWLEKSKPSELDLAMEEALDFMDAYDSDPKNLPE